MWLSDIELEKSKYRSVVMWVKFQGLNVKYWSVISLSKIGSLVGKLFFVNVNIQTKAGINFVRLFIDVEIGYILK